MDEISAREYEALLAVGQAALDARGGRGWLENAGPATRPTVDAASTAGDELNA